MAGLTDRVAFVTGASQGIGRACALMLAAGGAAVALAARNASKLEHVVQEIRSMGGRAACFPVDVSDDADAAAAVAEAIRHFGRIEILVNNAGIIKDGLLMRMKFSDWDQVLRTNLNGTYSCTRAVVGAMVNQRWGRIINITSIFGQMGQIGQSNYSASKAGIIGFTMAVAREFASRNITANAIAPGYIETAMTESLSSDLKSRIKEQIPLARPGTDADVAHAVKFLASDEAGYITGHVLKVNGGLLMG